MEHCCSAIEKEALNYVQGGRAQLLDMLSPKL